MPHSGPNTAGSMVLIPAAGHSKDGIYRCIVASNEILVLEVIWPDPEALAPLKPLE